ncbi:MAG: molybdopterin adenylyltransferase [Moraxella sp.]|nr:MAG: molybdopterin adenylyltransferase [Moraxella sp.]
MTTTQPQLPKKLTIGLISISDRASLGVYEDKGIPALTDWLKKAIIGDFDIHHALIADDQTTIEQTLKHFADKLGCQLILTTGGTGPTKRDVTPEATLAIADKEMYGFGEQMRQVSLHFVPTAILSRQVAVVRNDSLIINLPGQPKAIKETLEGVKDKDGNVLVKGIFSAVAYGVELISGVYFETDAAICESFRPKSAKRS